MKSRPLRILGPAKKSLRIFSSIELENGNSEKAKELFQRGRNYGARAKSILYNLKNKEDAEKLIKNLEPLGVA